jgi:hypothetical protein
MLITPLQMLVVMRAGWVNEQHRAVNAYLKEENRVLRQLHGAERLRGGGAFEITLEESESERLRGALSPLDQFGVRRPDGHAR